MVNLIAQLTGAEEKAKALTPRNEEVMKKKEETMRKRLKAY